MRINFVGFAPGFIKTDNYFYHLLSGKYDIEIDNDDPEIVFFSIDPYGKREIEKYPNAFKIFFTDKDIKPNLTKKVVKDGSYHIHRADISLSSHYIDDRRHYRFPAWAYNVNWFRLKYNHRRLPAYMPSTMILESAYRRDFDKPSGFCCMVSSKRNDMRINLFDEISRYKQVDSGGDLCKNVDRILGRGDQIGKIDFMSKYKFTIVVESSKTDGFTTEQLLHPLSVGSIPIYYGNELVDKDINPNSIINASGYRGNDLIDLLREIDNDDKLFKNIVAEPVTHMPKNFLTENVLQFIESHF